MIRLLLVEDEPAMAYTAALYLNFDGDLYDITVKETLKAAIEELRAVKLAKTPYDVILLDLGLTDSRGIATLVDIVKEFPEVPIVVLTGIVEEDLAMKATQAGADGYTEKATITRPQLVNEIAAAMERKKQINALKESHAKVMESLQHVEVTRTMMKEAAPDKD